ncbi:hypothetical protein SAMN05444143_1422 [Flavobacterium succinicans]|uniref:Uncharacterized protein n=1 Tax=Flavobacterium succinicans TaxID=29536 RepID=A0A1I5AGN4_9FLAO|nr:hypothetical protein [Flavobacterium succinicans]SFN61634.1 hypothetical protein SAMN05444143_1422 [Flavobacterium succinicans]
MKKPNILNNLNILQKVTIEENNTILFFFGDTPNWNKKEVIKDVVNSDDFYEVIEINFNFDYKDLTRLYWKIHRYIGEEFFIEFDNGKINIWEGEISDNEECWGTFDDLEDEILIINYKKYNVQKSSQDWKNDYENLRKRYYSLYKKKKIQLDDFREKIKSELKEKIEKHLEQKIKQKRNYINSDNFTEEDVNQVISLALNDLHNGVRIDLFTEFLYNE